MADPKNPVPDAEEAVEAQRFIANDVMVLGHTLGEIKDDRPATDSYTPRKAMPMRTWTVLLPGHSKTSRVYEVENEKKGTKLTEQKPVLRPYAADLEFSLNPKEYVVGISFHSLTRTS